jgi:hypothetical protein
MHVQVGATARGGRFAALLVVHTVSLSDSEIPCPTARLAVLLSDGMAFGFRAPVSGSMSVSW